MKGKERNHCTFLHNEKRKSLQCRGALQLSFNFQLIWKLGTSLWSQCSTASKTHIIKWRKQKKQKTNLKIFWNKNMDFFMNWRPAVIQHHSSHSLPLSFINTHKCGRAFSFIEYFLHCDITTFSYIKVFCSYWKHYIKSLQAVIRYIHSQTIKHCCVRESKNTLRFNECAASIKRFFEMPPATGQTTTPLCVSLKMGDINKNQKDESCTNQCDSAALWGMTGCAVPWKKYFPLPNVLFICISSHFNVSD